MLLIAAKGRPYLDSDMSSEMVLANLLNQEGGLLSANWWYSTELRVFYLQIFYRLGLLLFPQDWFMARVLGQALWMLALFAAYIYMARGMGLTQSGAWGVAALACPFGAWYFWYGAYSGFYLPNMILILFSLGAVLRLLKPKAGVRRAVQWAILAVVCFAAGLSSMKTLMAMFLPLPVAAAAMAAREFRKNGAFGENKTAADRLRDCERDCVFRLSDQRCGAYEKVFVYRIGRRDVFGVRNRRFSFVDLALFCAVRLSGGQLLGHEYPRAVDSRRAWRVWHPDGAGDCGFAGSAAQARGYA